MSLKEDAVRIIEAALRAADPDRAVKKALEEMPETEGRIYLLAIGKAGWQMAKSAEEFLADRLTEGICITKYGHVKQELKKVKCYEAAHPVPDENGILATRAAKEMLKEMKEDDLVVFLISGGGSALFEDSPVPLAEIQKITETLLKSGASIQEINTIRKRLSSVKAGRFAEYLKPAGVYCVILSDVLGDDLSSIASGPAVADMQTGEEAMKIVSHYGLQLSESALNCLKEETPKKTDNSICVLAGSVRILCEAAEQQAQKLGYQTHILSDCLDLEAKEAGYFLAAMGRYYGKKREKHAFICGGETVVHVQGEGLGGRNQELALAAAIGLEKTDNALVFALGSDGTDGPTNAAGAMADGQTVAKMAEKNVDAKKSLEDNDSYHAFKAIDSLIITGPTGTNVNDLYVLLTGETQA